jgi:HPt (histidine-containing phosphotransfer) domain-containing protein
LEFAKYYCQKPAFCYKIEAVFSWGVNMADVIYINEEDGKKRVMNNGKLYAKLLTKFKTDTNLDDLASSAGAQDWDKAQAAAHTIKGIAANLSLTELFNQSLDVETQVKGRSLKPESLESLKACYNETLTAVDKVIAQYV